MTRMPVKIVKNFGYGAAGHRLGITGEDLHGGCQDKIERAVTSGS